MCFRIVLATLLLWFCVACKQTHTVNSELAQAVLIQQKQARAAIENCTYRLRSFTGTLFADESKHRFRPAIVEAMDSVHLLCEQSLERLDALYPETTAPSRNVKAEIQSITEQLKGDLLTFWEWYFAEYQSLLQLNEEETAILLSQKVELINRNQLLPVSTVQHINTLEQQLMIHQAQTAVACIELAFSESIAFAMSHRGFDYGWYPEVNIFANGYAQALLQPIAKNQFYQNDMRLQINGQEAMLFTAVMGETFVGAVDSVRLTGSYLNRYYGEWENLFYENEIVVPVNR